MEHTKAPTPPFAFCFLLRLMFRDGLFVGRLISLCSIRNISGTRRGVAARHEKYEYSFVLLIAINLRSFGRYPHTKLFVHRARLLKRFFTI